MLHFKRITTVLLFLLFIPLSYNAQKLQGLVVDSKSLELIPGTHVVNKSTLKGDLTNADGEFEIALQWGDTVVFSNIAYKYFYFVYNDSATALKNVVIEMEEQNYMLNEVSIFSYKLTSNDDKPIEFRKPSTPANSELSDGRIASATMANPAEYLYNLFGSKPRQLRELARLRAEDYYREKLEQSNNRKSVIILTGLSREELEAFMFYCKFAPVRMQTMNDYEFLMSVQRCYHQYVNDRELENFLEQFD